MYTWQMMLARHIHIHMLLVLHGDYQGMPTSFKTKKQQQHSLSMQALRKNK